VTRPAPQGNAPGSPDPACKLLPQDCLIDAAHAGLPQPRRTWAAISIWLAMAVSVLDNSIVALALPTLGRTFGTSAAATVWVVSSYQLAIAMVLLPLASLSDIMGHRRMYLAGLALFAAASIACGAAPSLAVLTISRFAQGIGAAAIMGVNAALIRATFPSAQLGRAVGYNSLVAAICSAAGPSLAGLVLTHASWRWLFIINVPIGVLAIVISAAALPPGVKTPRRFDGKAALFSAAAFGGFFLAATDLVQGPPSWISLSELALASVTGWLLVQRERGQKAPLLPLDLIRYPTLRLSYAASVAAFSAMTLVLIASPFYLQHFGFDAATIGLLVSPLPVGLMICAPVAGWLTDRYSAGLLGASGMSLFVAGTLMLGLAPQASLVPFFALGMTACGIGFGLFHTPNNWTMIGSAPASRMGAAAGMQAISRTTGQLTGSVLTAGVFHLSGPGTGRTAFLAAAMALTAGFFSIRRLNASAQ
jgi:DHA2 family multidrug resistance protein-like MFS transporter